MSRAALAWRHVAQIRLRRVLLTAHHSLRLWVWHLLLVSVLVMLLGLRHACLRVGRLLKVAARKLLVHVGTSLRHALHLPPRVLHIHLHRCVLHVLLL